MRVLLIKKTEQPPGSGKRYHGKNQVNGHEFAKSEKAENSNQLCNHIIALFIEITGICNISQ